MTSNPVQRKISSYPIAARAKAAELRIVILAVAEQLEKPVEESLKWGEPAWLVLGGSTVRVQWSTKTPDALALHFNCKSQLVETFREIYREELRYEGNRTVWLPLDKALPIPILQHCVSLAFRYHTIKHLPLLGA